MKPKQIYYRRKGKQIIAEGKTFLYGKIKTIYLFNLPPIEKLLKASIFPPEKTQKIVEKIKRLKQSQKKSLKSSHIQDCTHSGENKKEDAKTHTP